MNRIISGQLRTFIYQNFLLGPDFDLGDSDSFLEHGVIDSMGVLELIAYLHETYGINVENEELIPDNLDTIENLTAYVSRKLDATAAASPRDSFREQV